MANEKMTQQWFAKARVDLNAAKFLFEANNEDLFSVIAFHSQQCAEKAMKGY